MSKNIGTLLNAAGSYAERSKASRLVDSWSEETAQEFQTLASRLLKSVEDLAAREKAINANVNLTPTGKFDQVKIAVKDFVAGLRWLRDLKGVTETRIGNAFGDLFLLKPSTRTDQAMRDQEIRRVIGALALRRLIPSVPTPRDKSVH